MKRRAVNMYFSPGGTTARISGYIAAQMACPAEEVDLLTRTIPPEKVVGASDIAIVSMPVFAGRIPGICADMLEGLRGNNTPAVAVVVYGNRAYDDALVELTDILKKNGFWIAGAAALVARHSIFPKVAANRPDDRDLEQIRGFASGCLAAIDAAGGQSVAVAGNRPYRQPGKFPLVPSSGAGCSACGACARICPVGAVAPERPYRTDRERCINCTACIHACPTKARRYRGPGFAMAGYQFRRKYHLRLEPVFFLPQEV